MMKVCVFGSFRFGGEEVQEEFREICRKLGATLAKKGHQLIIASDASYAAERYIVEGVNEKQGLHKIVAYYETTKPFDDEKDKFKQIKFHYKTITRPWPVKGIEQIKAADAVILIGGTKTTKLMGHIAPTLQKPVLAIPASHGSAEELWPGFLEVYEKVLDSPDTLQSYANDWSEKSADVLIDYLKQLAKRNPYADKSFWGTLVLFSVIVFLLAIWLIVLFNPVGSPLLSFFLLLVSASWLGTGLRTLVRMIKNVSPHICWRELILEGITSVVLAFGLGLIYLTGALTATGELKLLDPEQTGEFLRVGITASLLGLAAGLLLEQATDRLKNMLGKIIGE